MKCQRCKEKTNTLNNSTFKKEELICNSCKDTEKLHNRVHKTIKREKKKWNIE